MAGPLDGIRIIDLTQVLSGPYGTLQLSEQGADVVKVEPADGDGMRNSGMYNHRGLCAVGATANRGKRSIALDLTTDAGAQIVRELCADADVFVQNFRPGVVERLGLDPTELRAANPRLITVSISGYGTDGPMRDMPVFDPVVQAVTGHVALQVNPEIPVPDLIRNAVIDKVTSSYLAQAVTAALFHRERVGDAQHVDLAMLDASLYFFWPDGMMTETWLNDDVRPTPTLAERYQLTPCKDGQIIFFAGTQRQRMGLFRAIGRPELCDDPQLNEVSLSGTDGALERFAEITGSALLQMTMTEAETALVDNDVPCGRVVPIDEVVAHPQVIANDSVIEFDDPHYGRIRQVRSPARFRGTPTESRPGIPPVGSHTDEILTGVGYDAEAVDRLRRDGVVF